MISKFSVKTPKVVPKSYSQLVFDLNLVHFITLDFPVYFRQRKMDKENGMERKMERKKKAGKQEGVLTKKIKSHRENIIEIT